MKCLVDGQVTTDTIATCTGYVLLEPVDVQAVQTFDSELYTTVTGILLVSFLTGHLAGRTVRWLGKG